MNKIFQFFNNYIDKLICRWCGRANLLHDHGDYTYSSQLEHEPVKSSHSTDFIEYSSDDLDQLVSGDCAAKANQLAASYGNAQVMSVTQNGSNCTVVIRVKDANGGPSRIIKKTISG